MGLGGEMGVSSTNRTRRGLGSGVKPTHEKDVLGGQTSLTKQENQDRPGVLREGP